MLGVFIALALAPANLFAEEAHLWFKTVFDGPKVYGTPPVTTDPNKYEVMPKLMGKDRVTGYRIPEDLPGVHWTDADAGRSSGHNKFSTNIYPSYKRYLPKLIDISVKRVEDGPNGKPAYVLHQEKNKRPADVPKGVYISNGLSTKWYIKQKYGSSDPKRNFKTIYMRCYMRHHFNWNVAQWRQVSQTVYIDDGNAARSKWTIFIVRDKGINKWMFKGTRLAHTGDPKHPYRNQDVWVESNTEHPVIDNKWFKYEIYVKYSSEKDGVILVAVDDHIIFKRFDWNYESKSLKPRDFRLTGTYGANGYQQTTNLELWDRPPADSVLSKYIKGESISLSNTENFSNKKSEEKPSFANKFIMKKGVLE